MKAQVKFTESELTRPSKFIIVVSDRNIDTHIIDIEEGKEYVQKYNRRAIIVSSKAIFKNKELALLKYNFIMNATTPALKLIDHCGQSYKVVYQFLNANYKNGCIIAHDDTLTNEIADMLAQNKGNGLDFILYRQDLMQLSGNEKHQVNYIRFHANNDFIFSKDNFKQYVEKFGNNPAIGIFTSQLIANYQFSLTQKYFEQYSEKYKSMGASDYIDYYELNKQNAYHVYYDVMKSKILGFTKEKIQFYMELMFHSIGDKAMQNKAVDLAAFYI